MATSDNRGFHMEARHIDMGYWPSSGASEGLVPRDLIRVVTDNLWAVVGIAAVMTALASAYALFAMPLYSADTLVQVEVPKQNELADLVSKQPSQNNSSPDGPPTETEMAIVTSRAVLAPVIAQYKLDVVVTPHRFPVLGKISEALATRGEPSRAWLGLSKYAWGGEQVDISQLSVPRELLDKKLELKVLDGRHYQLLDEQGNVLVSGVEGPLAQSGAVSMQVDQLAARNGETFTVERLDEVSAVQRFLKRLKVTQVGKETGIVQIRYENGDPALATAVANAVTQNYIGSRVMQTQEEASKMLAFINNELPRLRDELRQAEAQLQAHRVASGSMQASTESQSYLQGSIDFDRQIAALSLQRTQLLDRFTPQSPEVRTLDAQLAQLRAAKGKFEARFDSMPSADRQSADLARDAKVAEEIYVAMVNKAHELSVSRAGTVGNVHVIDTAVQPSTPVKPRRALIISAAIVLGLMLGVLYVISRRYLSQSVSEPEQIEGKLRLPVFGAVLFSDEQARLARMPPLPVLLGAREPSLHGKVRGATALVAPAGAAAGGYPARPHAGGLLAAARPRDVATEALRGIRTMLNSKLLSAPNRIVMITGATPGTGKSFISANLALLYAQAGKRVLLIDADLRRGRLGTHFGLTADTVGLANLLGAGLTPEQAIHPTSVANLSLLPAGTRPGNPSELLAMERLPEQLAQFSSQYDLVLVDTPPVLAVADASIVAGYAGATVLVMRENAQTEMEVEETLKRLGRVGAQVAGAIFNGMSARRSDRRSYEYIHTPDAVAAVSSRAQPAASGTLASERGSAAQWPAPIAVNGKFTSQRLTGVQRVARELTAALSQQLRAQASSALLLVPRDHLDSELPAATPRHVVPPLRGILWEQLALPFAAGSRTLLSLCNIGPLFKRRQVLMIHDAAVFDLPEGYSRKFRLWYRFAFALLKRNVRHILTVSTFSKGRIAARLGVPPERISVIPPGVDHFDRLDSDYAVLRRLNLSFDRFVLIVGSLAPGKNLARTLEAIALLEREHPELTFVIAGGQNVRVFGSTLPHGAGAAKRIAWAGYVSDGELKALYENAGCFVFPSLYEGFGLPPLEAMYCGCPVIASREASLPEVCGDAALYCDAHDAADIAAKVAELMGDVEQRRVMRLKGRAHAQQYRWDVSASRVMRVLRQFG
ncbi:hypothetical protein DFQ28_003056 [Apophysomyces sp. BC1034]|nr:hypothetical protein DFQ28_003056 [Apophysomyces sp. BC1034]